VRSSAGYCFVTVAVAEENDPGDAVAVNEFVVQLPFWALKVKGAVEVAAPLAGMVSVTLDPEVGAVNEPLPEVFDTVIVCAEPTLATTLPYRSVTLTRAVNVWLFPRAVTVQVKRQGSLGVPAETATLVHASFVADAAFTVTELDVPERFPLVTVIVLAPDLYRVTATEPTPFVKVTLVDAGVGAFPLADD